MKQCYKHKRGAQPSTELPKGVTTATYQAQSQTPQSQTPKTHPSTATTQTTGLDAYPSASASTSTLPPLDTEFLADLDFSASGIGADGGMFAGDGFDWDALLSDGEWWNNIGGGWNEADLTAGFGGS